MSKSLLGLLALTSCIAWPSLGLAQMMVRTVPDSEAAAQDPNTLPYLPENSGGRDSLSAGPNAPRPDVPAADQPPDENRAVDQDALIREYIMKAGPVGPRKWFSAMRFNVTFGVGEVYDDNILVSTNGPKRDDFITTVIGAARLSLGDFAQKSNTYVIGSYAGTGNFFAKHGGQNSYDQDADVDVLYRLHQLSFASNSTFQERHDATSDFGQRLERFIYGEDFVAKYRYSTLTALSAAVHFEHDNNQSEADTSDLSLTLAADYAVTSKVTLGVGVEGERLTSTGALEEYAGSAQLRMGYAVTKRVKAAASFGIEYRDRGNNASDSVTPVFDITANWTPFVDTALDLEAHRRTQASGALDGEDFIDTGFQLGIRQNFLGRYYLRLDVGYQNADYSNVTAAQSTARTDNYYSIRGTAGYDFVRWFRVLAFYEHREDTSTRALNSFTSNRMGMEFNLNY